MRVPDKPLPGDFIIRFRQERPVMRHHEIWFVTRWPDAETIVAGPYQSYSYALRQASTLVKREEWIWRDHATSGQSELLEFVGGGAAPV